MVEIEDITDDSGSDGQKKEGISETKERPPPPKGYKYRKTKKELPSVAHLLAHGAPESEGKPKTFCDKYGYGIFLAICFAISLLVFHYAPHERSVQPRGKFSVPANRKRQQMKQQHAGQESRIPPIEDDESEKLSDPNPKHVDQGEL